MNEEIERKEKRDIDIKLEMERKIERKRGRERYVE